MHSDRYLSAFIGVRKGSTRCINKNFRPFSSNGQSLLEVKINQLVKLSCLDEIVVSTNCESCMAQAENLSLTDARIKIVSRPDNLGNSSTPVREFIKHVGNSCNYDNVLWTHATSPYVDDRAMSIAINQYFNLEDTTIFSANKIQNFLWDPKQSIVFNTPDTHNNLVNTQILAPLYETNHAFYLIRRGFLLEGIRMPTNSVPFVCKNLQCIDIDDENDFIYAQRLESCAQVKNTLFSES